MARSSKGIGRERERKKLEVGGASAALSVTLQMNQDGELGCVRPPGFISADNRQGTGGCAVGHILSSNVPPSRFLLIRAESVPAGRFAT